MEASNSAPESTSQVVNTAEAREKALKNILNRLDPKQFKKVLIAPITARTILGRAFLGEVGPTYAIKAMCLQCTNFDRKRMSACTDTGCALHRYRPFQKSSDSDDENDDQN